MGLGGRLRHSRYVIWDWNGTLLDDMWLTLRVTNSLLADRGLSLLDRETYREVFGFPLVDYYRRIGLDLDKESFKELSREWNLLYETEREGCSLFLGIGNLIESLWLDGWGQCVVSAYEEKKLKELIGFHGLCRFFSEICGLDNDEGFGKIELGLKFVENFYQKIDLDTTVYVGDTVHDAEVARAMKVECLLVSYGHQSRRRLEATGFNVVNNTKELFNKLQSWQKES